MMIAFACLAIPVDDAASRVVAAGTPMTRGPEDSPPAGRVAVFTDPSRQTELLNLMLDHVKRPDRRLPADRGWRLTLEHVARDGRRNYLEHPWLMQVNWSRPVMGPNIMADLERTLTGLSDLPFSDQEKMTVVSMLDAYVTGSVREEILFASAAVESGMSDEEFWHLQLPVLLASAETGDYPTMATLSDDAFDGGFEESFELGLELLLDGLEQRVARRGT